MIWSRIKKAFRHSQEPDAIEIIQAYGAVLQQRTMGFDGSRSINDLPFEKGLIKIALISAATLEDLSDEMLGALGVGYVELASFQHGGGGENPITDLKVDLGSMSQEDVRGFALTMAKKMKQAKEGREDLGEAVLAEMKNLSEEWNLIVEERGTR